MINGEIGADEVDELAKTNWDENHGDYGIARNYAITPSHNNVTHSWRSSHNWTKYCMYSSVICA